ncbi:Wzt carbohydrate-binding domain-containing protein [Paraburkholderia caffeinilytica]|uniref:Wzt carbohydrate-binding domain-containing protein n=1 Tax=Paraburkholderia caffeinilytica TaxID=1761016 RepID=UPI003D9FE7BA
MITGDDVFSGRVIFDHLPKTAGQAINAWLVEALGAGCVTTNLIGDHRDLIRKYGGLYSIISAHVFFHNAEQLDPRYQYMTFFRDPIDRAISWIFYLSNNVGIVRKTVAHKDGASRFLASDGCDASPEFIESISNPYTEHFCRILGDGTESDEVKVANAFAAIQKYAVVGIYENMSNFLEEAAALIGINPPIELAQVNVTNQRPAVEKVSPVLRKRIEELNQLDLRLYAAVVAWKTSAEKTNVAKISRQTVSGWRKYEPTLARTFSAPDITIHSAMLQQGYDIRHGQPITFDVDFSLSRDVKGLEMGIHLFDSDGQWAFGINSTLLGQTHQFVTAGRYCVSHHLIPNLPAGTYTAGFAFTERSPEGAQELAWHDAMCEFQIYHEVSRTFAGYSYLPAEISLRAIDSAENIAADGIAQGYRFLGIDDRVCTQVGIRVGHEIACTGRAGYLTFGPYIPLAAGRYRLAIRGVLGKAGFAGAYMDVVVDKGDRVIAERHLVERDSEECLVILPILLAASCVDLEVRVLVTDSTDLRLSMIEIWPWESEEVHIHVPTAILDGSDELVECSVSSNATGDSNE